MDTATLPDWLAPDQIDKDHDPIYPRTKEHRALREIELRALTYRSLPLVAGGGNIVKFLAMQHPRQDNSNMPPVQLDEFMRFVRRNPDLKKAYEEAEEFGADYLIAEALAIADGSPEYTHPEEDVNSRKLRVDMRKWVAEKVYRKKYGDKIDISSTTTNTTTITLQTLVDQRRLQMENILEGEATRVG